MGLYPQTWPRFVNRPPIYKGFLFDFDGVLSDSECFTWPIVQRVLTQFGLAQVEHQKDVGGWTWQAIAELVSESRAVDPTLLADVCATAFQKKVLEEPRSIPGAREALNFASKLGAVAIVTGSRVDVVRRWLEHFSLHDCVDTIVAAGMYRRAKPDPECYRMALDRLALKPGDGLVFEDSNAGIQAAASAHLSVVAIANGQPRGEHIRRLITTEFDSFIPLLDTFFRVV